MGLGSNLGDREAHLDHAVRRLHDVCTRVRVSTIYETLPRYRTDQPSYLNCVARGNARSTPREFLYFLQRVEKERGRDRLGAGWMGPRTLDADMLLYGSLTIREPDLTVPHPRIRERKFVLIPMLELDPELVDPETGRRYRRYIRALAPQGIYYRSLDRYSCYRP